MITNFSERQQSPFNCFKILKKEKTLTDDYESIIEEKDFNSSWEKTES